MAIGKNKPQSGFFILKHIGLFAGMALLILVIDVFLYIAIALFEGQISYADGPDSANSEARIDIAEVAHSLVQDEQGNWVLDNQNLLNQMDVRDCWTVLLDQNGTVVWSYNTPQDFPTSFTQNEIAVISHDRAYGSSSTFIWTKDPNLVIMGYPGNQYLTWGITLSEQAFIRIPLYLLLVFTIDLLLIFLLYVFSQRSLLKSTGPMLDALDNLAQGKPAKVRFSGMLRVVGNRINAVSDTLFRKETARKNWVAGVSHDVRTPLAIAMGHAEQLEHNASLSEDARESAAIITRQGIRIRDLIEDLNIATQLEYDMQPLKIDTIVVAKTLRSVVVDYLNQGIDDHAEFDLDIAETASQALIKGDERLLKRALRNAIDNSLKHNPDHCRITISLNINEKGVALCVADDGRGMNTEQLLGLAAMLERDYLGIGSLTSYTDTSITFSKANSFMPPQQIEGGPDLPPHNTAHSYQAGAPTISAQKPPLGSEPPLPAKKRPPRPPAAALEEQGSDVAASRFANTASSRFATTTASELETSTASEFTGRGFQSGPGLQSSHDRGLYPEPGLQNSLINNQNGSLVNNAPIPHDGSIGKHGLGLPLIARIVLVHEGTLTIASAEGAGFSIIMTFPVVITSLEDQQ